MSRRKVTSKRRKKYQILTLEDLRTVANWSATWRGHELDWHGIKKTCASAGCIKCDADIYVELRPADEFHVISGSAQLHTCPHEPDLP